MVKVFVIDIDKCSGCYSCQFACKDEYVGNDWTPYSKPQPDTGHFWMKIREMERGTIPKVIVTYVPTPCMHCNNAPCIPACPVNAIYKRADGLVLIDPAVCNGCKACIEACPYGAIYFNTDLNIAQKCTGCTHLLDHADETTDPGLKLPRCVDACHTGAIMFGEYEDLKDSIAKAEVLKPELGTQPSVYYLNLPKPFIAGAVYSPEQDECLQGATVTATDLSSGAIYVAETDELGDFWLKNLEYKHVYSLRIEKQGYYPKTIGVVYTEKDVNLGDIALFKKP